MRALVLACLIAVTMGAQAAVVYRNVVGQGDVVEFTDEPAEWCAAGAPPGVLKATWKVNAGPRKGEVVRGCYVIDGDRVLMAFEDGDKYAVPLEVVKKLHERGGA